MKLLNRAIGLLVGILGGMLARSVFKRIWQAVTGEDEAPKATDARRGWREILLAAALQGAIFAVVQAALDRATAEGPPSSPANGPAKARRRAPTTGEAESGSRRSRPAAEAASGNVARPAATDAAGGASRSVRDDDCEFLLPSRRASGIRNHGELLSWRNWPH